MKYGTFITKQRGEAIAADVRAAESLGFESAWIAEHLIMPVNQTSAYPYSPDGRFLVPADAPFHDPLLALAYVAALTTKIRLATGIFVLPLRNAFTTAKAIATLDQLSQGRVIFGVGIGWLKEEFDAVGMKFEDRAIRTREYLELMIELWSKSDPIYKGRTISTAGMKFMPKTVQQPHPPIVFGGTSEPALRRTVRLGDGWYGIAHSLEEARSQIAKLREFARATGRTRPIEITLSLRTGKPLSADDVRRMAEMGVDRTLAGLPIRALEGADLERFRAEIMDKV
ncbi:MAG TPA: TIGR03619 family F420-dependent LLM class oxidoreductase [Candidatus Binataceae bacterium]|jgi:probable F420-dependent oxidoreductase